MMGSSSVVNSAKYVIAICTLASIEVDDDSKLITVTVRASSSERLERNRRTKGNEGKLEKGRSYLYAARMKLSQR